MSLVNKERLNRRSWTELPMGSDIIVRVEAMALEQGQPLLKRGDNFGMETRFTNY